ncbi:MAG: divergent PAP2 family protein [Oscillospiraceae bacterium]|nr:divergent PAP2 family protein [Oscillospiraceae bacterium]
MHHLSDLLNNHLIINSLAAWAAAQVLKTIIYAVAQKKWDWERLFGDGGMPSGHSATVTALSVTAGIEYGLGSAPFAISAILATVVMHDAMGVRLEAGKHAKALNELMNMVSSKDLTPDDKLKELLGHTPLQVCFGALLGLAMALLLSL